MLGASRPGAARAFADGAARVASAPAVAAGTIALAALYGPSPGVRHAAGACLLWAFLSGGILDRYARQRPIRAHGFFGACGAHVGVMIRLGLTVLAVFVSFHAAIGGAFPNDYVHEAAFGIALLVMLVVSFAQVRVAVEDRRSALGALAAGGRFVARNPSALLPFGVIVAAGIGAMLLREGVLASAAPDWLLDDLEIAVLLLLALVWLATAVAFFQSRLAHAGYTAAPPPVWPESPAAEAIVNGSSRLAP